jgi:hypothetical protein
MASSERIPLMTLSNKRRKTQPHVGTKSSKEHTSKGSKERAFKKAEKEPEHGNLDANESKLKFALKEVCLENDQVDIC